MVTFRMHFNHRAPEGGVSREELFAAALDISSWADGVGVDGVVFSEHHGSEDGYVPSPIVVAAAHAARTKRLQVSVGCFLLAYHDPIRAAEDLAVLDNVAGGRFTGVLVGAGYAVHEFPMFRLDPTKRGQIFEENVAVLNQAWTGEPFEYYGSTVRVTPRPFTRPRPAITIGGSSKAMARRAARLIAQGYADDFWPDVVGDVYETYREERTNLGLEQVPPYPTDTMLGEVAVGLYVAEDTERAWEEVGPYFLHDNMSLHRWMKRAGEAPPGARTLFREETFTDAEDVASLKANPLYRVLTPDECIDYARRTGLFFFNPLCGGLPPKLAWESLELIESRVLPALAADPAPAPPSVSSTPRWLTGAGAV